MMSETSTAAERPASRAPHVLLAVSGGIAAYKACELLRMLQKAGCDVRVVMSEDAVRFVGVATFQALSGHPVVTSLFGDASDPIPHISLSDYADLCVVAPATANVMAKMAAGVADDALTTTLLAVRCPVLMAPAMNVHMWHHPATQANLKTLLGRGVQVVDPASGLLACGETGQGKLAAVEDIAAAALALVSRFAAGALAGRRVVVNAGPTHEAIDAVRFIANSSTGKMGYAIAREAALQGAQVTLVSGPCALPAPAGVRRVNVVSAAQMLTATCEAFDAADAAVCAAAVADYTPARPADHKLKKGREPLRAVELRQTEDILATLAERKGSRVVIGFAAETDDLIANARDKLARKGADLIVANDVSRPDSTFGSDTSRVALVGADGVEQLDTLPLADVARAVVGRLARLLGTRGRLT
ncbi:bifunctional phosphopantothenoylcysteine decarboxylase/phosphopantothenate--cysteine ligase CoaBC [Olsenella massiliensis]|uniref:bifunctional phosphopantothenoylcysteine decarboxylase/phosphopantothenate--cysteine ligase CoaBC n=1 Tax=Olsenella massiliensis TaxID=1622075 RepID=UPI00071D2852